ncbi:protein GVQW3-like [Palaemon carinicauda]|uniref:protein GVQW3-like n=1 Tax=Palaemon carinicauda TaxID=392227 RepID=UPI0035B69389
MENQNFEVRANIKFLTKLDWKPGKIIETLQQVYGDFSPSKSVVYDWIKRFKDGREDLKDIPRNGQPLTATNERTLALVENLVDEDRRITIVMRANETGISHGSAFSAHWVPKALRKDQLHQTAELSLAVLTKIKSNESEFIDRIVT